MLLTGRKPLFISAYIAEGEEWHSEVYDEPPWPADDKIVAEELGPARAGPGRSAALTRERRTTARSTVVA